MQNLSDVPDPTLALSDWIAKLVEKNETVNLREYRDAAGKDRKLWLIEAARHLTTGMHSKVLKVDLKQVGDDKVNCYSASEEAIAWWQNGKEQSLSNKEILDGWTAMQSVLKDGKEES